MLVTYMKGLPDENSESWGLVRAAVADSLFDVSTCKIPASLNLIAVCASSHPSSHFVLSSLL